jgi:hypothetical protein
MRDNLSEAEKCEIATNIIETQLTRGLTPAEAVDYIAVEKADRKNKEWAASVRDVSASAVSGNIGQARERINTNRLDAEVYTKDGDIVVVVADRSGEEQELPFSKQTNVVGYGDASLMLVYEAFSAVHGFYRGEDGQEFEATLWYDGRPANTFEEFDRFGEYGSPQAKADSILWESESIE